MNQILVTIAICLGTFVGFMLILSSNVPLHRPYQEKKENVLKDHPKETKLLYVQAFLAQVKAAITAIDTQIATEPDASKRFDLKLKRQDLIKLRRQTEEALRKAK